MKPSIWHLASLAGLVNWATKAETKAETMAETKAETKAASETCAGREISRDFEHAIYWRFDLITSV